VSQAYDIPGIVPSFDIHGRLTEHAPYGSGHINDTFRIVMEHNGRQTPYILQRINHLIFRDTDALMANIVRVTAHVRAKLGGAPDAIRRTLTVIPTRAGGVLHRDADGNSWRAYVFITGARTYDTIESPRQAFEAARAFGAFQAVLTDLPGPRLHDTIPDFHNTPKRLAALEAAIAADAVKRAHTCSDEIAFVLQRRETTRVLSDLQRSGEMPERITHNDTKLNNVMLDDATGEGVCVIDLDTVMPGLALHDFGDMVRSATNPAREDERDLSKVAMQFPMFEALVRGFTASAGGMLTAAEKRHLAFSGRLITLEIGMRFLTDYLSGDTYFKTHRPGQNLDRCRTQFKLVQSMEEQRDAMERLVERVLAGG
jgi:Ser/Thr protein kinase RdoA (MazF antagonist)